VKATNVEIRFKCVGVNVVIVLLFYNIHEESGNLILHLRSFNVMVSCFTLQRA